MDTDTTSSRPLSQNDNGPVCPGAAESDEEIVTPYRWLIRILSSSVPTKSRNWLLGRTYSPTHCGASLDIIVCQRAVQTNFPSLMMLRRERLALLLSPGSCGVQICEIFVFEEKGAVT